MVTASQRAAEINAEDRAWVAAGEDRYCGILVEDASHWAEYGIHTGEELDAYLAYSDYVDLSKDVYGWKDRRDWRQLSAAGWDEETACLREMLVARDRAEAVHQEWKDSIEACTPLTFNPFAVLKL
jgi:hypothetical protein